MTHENVKSMIFYFLERIDYSKTWEEIEFEIGYDLGDFNFENKECYAKVRSLVKHTWAELNGFLDSKGNFKK